MSRRTALLDLMLRTLVPAALSPICLVRRTLTRQTLAPFLLMLVLTSASLSAAEKSLPGTEPLSVEQPLDELMLDGLHRFCQKELQAARIRRQAAWSGPIADRQVESTRIEQLRQRLRICIGAVDSRLTADSAQRAEFELITTLEQSSVLARCRDVVLHRVRWPVLEGVTAEGLLLIPKEVRAGVIAVPDADWTPEAFSGHAQSADDPAPLAESVRAVRQLAEAGCLVVIPMLISRQDEFSGHPHVGFTNQPHREFLYRQAFEVGRHPIGYEVQKILAAVDLLSRQFALGQRLSDDKSSRERNQPLPIGVAGVGEGGLLALTAAALDPRIRVTWVRGYFSPRDELWREPIYRNVWGLLTEFGDAELAGLIAPRRLIIDPCPGVEIPGPPPVRDGRRNSAAPGRIQNPAASAVQEEFKQAAYRYQRTGHPAEIVLVPEASAAERPSALDAAVKAFAIGLQLDPGTIVKSVEPWQREPQRPQSSHSNAAPIEPSTKPTTHSADQTVHAREDRVREQRQFTELQQHVQTLLRRSHQVRDARWRPAIQTVHAVHVVDAIVGGRAGIAHREAGPRHAVVLEQPGLVWRA